VDKEKKGLASYAGVDLPAVDSHQAGRLGGWLPKARRRRRPLRCAGGVRKIGSTITIKYKSHYPFFDRLQVQKRTFIYRDLGPSSESYPFPQYNRVCRIACYLPSRAVGGKKVKEKKKKKQRSRPGVRYFIPSSLARTYPLNSTNQPTNQPPRVTGRVEPNQLDDDDDGDPPRSFPVLAFHHSRVLTNSNKKNKNAKGPLSGRDVKVQ
jgi:hypothetical protein